MVVVNYETVAESRMELPTTPEEKQSDYAKIMALFDECDVLADSIESRDVLEPEARLVLLAPMISDVSEAADELSEEYVALFENPGRTQTARNRVESSLRKIFMALEGYKLRAKKHNKDALAKVDRLVTHLQEAVDKVILLFVRVLDISVARIMQNQQAEEFKRRHREMFALHQLGMQLSQGH
jgi:hypothetical protein